MVLVSLCVSVWPLMYYNPWHDFNRKLRECNTLTRDVHPLPGNLKDWYQKQGTNCKQVHVVSVTLKENKKKLLRSQYTFQ